MNIFLVSNNPDECAQALDDLRLNKMILETGQMLCTAYRHHTKMREADPTTTYFWPLEFPGIYKETHKNHPCNVWLRESINNYKWTLNLFIALAEEKYYRTGKTHLTYTKLFEPLAIIPYNSYPAPKFTFDCSNVVPSTGNVFNNYKLCLANKWNNDIKAPTWTKRGMPDWYKSDSQIKLNRG